ncbi:MAG: SPOR domain-containing protein [Sphingorhabdus sp.]|uniref:SPOR domain-containing protein n=1 Tax=Sphingorhabdus sp. TaxID=1902408 RepID=UPI003458D18E|nr:SPOR domain-containing protein [Sphingorhabdus sp.]
MKNNIESDFPPFGNPKSESASPQLGITRLQAGPFASKADAEAICKKLKASGQPCLTLSAS